MNISNLLPHVPHIILNWENFVNPKTSKREGRPTEPGVVRRLGHICWVPLKKAVFYVIFQRLSERTLQKLVTGYDFGDFIFLNCDY